MPQDLHLDSFIVEDSDAYPITLDVRRAADPTEATDNGCSTENGKGSSGYSQSQPPTQHGASPVGPKATETIEAKYLIGGDGAHSWTGLWKQVSGFYTKSVS